MPRSLTPDPAAGAQPRGQWGGGQAGRPRGKARPGRGRARAGAGAGRGVAGPGSRPGNAGRWGRGCGPGAPAAPVRLLHGGNSSCILVLLARLRSLLLSFSLPSGSHSFFPLSLRASVLQVQQSLREHHGNLPTCAPVWRALQSPCPVSRADGASAGRGRQEGLRAVAARRGGVSCPGASDRPLRASLCSRQ